MDIELICTGDEVLTGKIVNSNFSYMAQKLEDFGFSVVRGITVGDDRTELLNAFRAAGQRADVVIVNGGLGPTVDDLSQEIAAEAAGVPLVMNEEWLTHMEAFFKRRGRTMSENNRKQALLPEGAELVDNPVGTACGFGVDIGKARFYFTPGVPRELRRMLEKELIPRMLERSGQRQVITLKRFHSYGLGESHVDQLLSGVESLVADGSLKVGFRAHYPQLETKLTVRGASEAEVADKLRPVTEEIHRRLGNFILAEDDETLEGVVSGLLRARAGTVAIVESFTGGQLAARLAPLAGAEQVFRQGRVVLHPGELRYMARLTEAIGPDDEPLTQPEVEAVASAARDESAATLGLAVLVQIKDVGDPVNLHGTVRIAIADGGAVASRESLLAGSRDWIRLGAVEMGLDALRRHLKGLPLYEKTDFERPPESA